ncbi:MAG TPA: hypothetical protein VMV81_09050 [Phycisphaerae bacterium]|nr:hypothetical protein [Phycisphaerae bacterium]
MNAPTQGILKHLGIGILAICAIGMALHQLRGFLSKGEEEARVWFFDQSEKKLYAMPRETVPPDVGIGGERDDGVRAMVVAERGEDGSTKNRRIAYLETYKPDLKKLFEEMRAAHAAGHKYDGKRPGRDDPFVRENTLVRRENESTWHDMTTPEGKAIVSEWLGWSSSDGRSLIVSLP